MLHLAVAALLVFPQAPTNEPQAPSAAPAIDQAPAAPTKPLFPMPSGPLCIDVPDADSAPTIADLVQEYCRLTGQSVVATQDTKGLLRNVRVGLFSSLDVPAEEVQFTFELLLRQTDFTLTQLKRDGQRIIEINSLATTARNNLRSSAHFLTPDEFAIAAQHPAMIFSTAVSLPNIDVRQVSNSMRTMITDANTQQMLPAGNSHSMVVVGFGDSITSMVQTLKVMDAEAATSRVGLERTTAVIRLEHQVAADLVPTLAALMPINPETPVALQPRILSDAKSNSLILVSTVRQIDEVKAVIAALDVASTK